jgi:hypothetical protein
MLSHFALNIVLRWTRLFIKLKESLWTSKTNRNLVGLVCLTCMNPADNIKQQAFLDGLSSYFWYGTHKVRSSEDLKKRI